jgi:hypothetical protein
MMSSGTSTERGTPVRDSTFHPWQFYLLLSMAGATAAVLLSRDTQPAALLLVSVAVFATGLVAIALHRALTGLLGVRRAESGAPLATRTREAIEYDKTIVLRSIKELEFDHNMRKVSDADFADIGGRLRQKAMALMEELGRDERSKERHQMQAPLVVSRTCPSCGTALDGDARFCKQCGVRVA